MTSLLNSSCRIEFYFILYVQRKKKVRAVNHELKLFSFGIDRRVLSFVVQQVCSLIASSEVAFHYWLEKWCHAQYPPLFESNRWITKHSDDSCVIAVWICCCTLKENNLIKYFVRHSFLYTLAVVVSSVRNVEHIPDWNLAHPLIIKIFEKNGWCFRFIIGQLLTQIIE